MSTSTAVAVVVVLLVIQACLAHISLRFPPARWPPLDFLDNSRTEEPCGVPRPNSPDYKPTILKAGQSYNISWWLAYPHQGGFSLEILDKNGVQKYLLTPENWTGIEDQTQQSFSVSIPKGFTCDNCVIRLQRQAQEWGNYKFWSCADVDIKPDFAPPLSNCFGNGTFKPNPIKSECSCKEGYYGEFCQFHDECVTDAECGHGKCLELESINSPKRVCYCSAPYFGEKCDKKFNPSIKDVQDGCFNYMGLNSTIFDMDNLYNSSCYTKTLIGKGENILYWRVVDKSVEVIMRFATVSWLGLGWHPLGIPSSCQDFPIKENVDVNKNIVQPKAEPHGNSSHPHPEPEPSSSNLHPMDCSDMVIGSAKGDLSRVGDFYTRDRSTPMEDGIYGGTNSLTAAYGKETGQTTIIMFRKPLEATERSDHSMTGKLQVIWAKGQTQGAYSHSAKSGLDEGKASVKNFYTNDVLKYHGNDNRGVLVMSFTDKSGRVGREGELEGRTAASNANFPPLWLGFLCSAVVRFFY